MTKKKLSIDKRKILDILSQVYDPDYTSRSILDMGLVTEEDIAIEDKKIEVTYGLTAPLCPFGAAIGLMIKYALEKKLKVPVRIKLKKGHYQEKAVAELLQDPQKSGELMRKLEEFGILKRCVQI